MIDIATTTTSSTLLPSASKRKISTLFAESFASNLPPTPPQSFRIQLLSDKATLPTKGSVYSAGWDLYSATNVTIPPQARVLVPLDLSMACPPHTYARIAPRSGLALKHGIHVGAGVIDADYRGPVSVLLFNLGEEEFTIRQGDRIAQCILEYVCMAEVEQVETLEETVRGSGGFGSTGVSSKEVVDATGTALSSSSPKKANNNVKSLSKQQETPSSSSSSSTEDGDSESD